MWSQRNRTATAPGAWILRPRRRVISRWSAILAAATLAVAPDGVLHAEEDADDAPQGISQSVPALSEMADASTVDLGASRVLHFYAAHLPSGAAPDPGAVVSALIVIHGHPRDANRTLAAGVLAAQRAGRASDTVVVAPLFQVSGSDAERCRFPGNPAAQQGDALWTCSSWIGGDQAEGGGPTSFAALDKLVAQLVRTWPHLQTITVAGFSAGAQFVQHAIGFARPPADVRVRYVVSDPGTWLYFDPQRPAPLIDGQPSSWKHCQDASCDFAWQPLDGAAVTACPEANTWKYGTEGLPVAAGSDADEARARYAAADVAYLEGELDTGRHRGTFHKILDKSCAAEMQGPYRLQRGLAYAAYDRRFLSANHALSIVPGCAHDVTCVFPSEVARPLLFSR